MIKTIYRSNRVFESKDKTSTASVVYEIGEMKSSIDTSMAVIADNVIIEVVNTFDEAMQSINKHWEEVKMEAMNKSIDKKLEQLTTPAVSGGWFDFYGSKNENRSIVYPKIDENIEFETTNGLILKGEFTKKHSVGVFWAKGWGYFYDEQVVRWRSTNDY